MTPTRRALLLLAAALAVAATAVLAGIAIATFLSLDARAAIAAERSSKDFAWSGTIAAGRTLSIHCINGSLSAHAASGNTVQVTAHKSARKADVEDARIDVIPHERGVTICVVYLDRKGRPMSSCDEDGSYHAEFDDDDNDVEVDFDIALPSGVDLDANLVNGSIEARDLDSDLELRTVNGSVDFGTTRTARAQTVNGGIHGSMGASSWIGGLSFQTVNGDVRLVLPRSLQASIKAETVNGEIDSDFPGRLEADWGPQKFVANASSDKSRLHVATVNGGVRLRQVP